MVESAQGWATVRLGFDTLIAEILVLIEIQCLIVFDWVNSEPYFTNQSINQSINVKFVGRCYTTRPGAPTDVTVTRKGVEVKFDWMSKWCRPTTAVSPVFILWLTTQYKAIKDSRLCLSALGVAADLCRHLANSTKHNLIR